LPVDFISLPAAEAEAAVDAPLEAALVACVVFTVVVVALVVAAVVAACVVVAAADVGACVVSAGSLRAFWQSGGKSWHVRSGLELPLIILAEHHCFGKSQLPSLPQV